MKEKTIEIRNLAIGYTSKRNKRIIAENINSDIFSGELTCLLGSNGIGKSTLLRTLSAFIPQLSGDIYISRKKLEEYGYKELSKVISVVLTEKIDVNITAKKLISMGRSPYTGFWGNLSATDEIMVDDTIALVKIEHLADRLVHTLSDGERQKVMITKALVQQTPIVLLDEPTAFLDFPSKVEIMQLLHELSRKTNKTIFLSTHDLELALQIADKIWLMDKQKGIQIGTPEDLTIDGSLNRFFAHKGIMFDYKTGLFRIENKFNKQIRLLGKGLVHDMVKKALSRNNIMASIDIESEPYILIANDEIRLFANDENYVTIPSIEELLKAIV